MVPKNLPEALILAEIICFAAAVVDLWQHHRAAVGHAEFVARKWRNAPRVQVVAVIKKITRIERRVAHEFECAAVHLLRAGFGNHVVEAGGSVPDLRRHHAGAGLHFLNRVHVEIGKRGAAQLRVRGVRAVDGEDRSDAALPVHRELLSEICRAVGVRHGARGQQQQFAEVALVQRQGRNFFF